MNGRVLSYALTSLLCAMQSAAFVVAGMMPVALVAGILGSVMAVLAEQSWGRQ